MSSPYEQAASVAADKAPELFVLVVLVVAILWLNNQRESAVRSDMATLQATISAQLSEHERQINDKLIQHMEKSIQTMESLSDHLKQLADHIGREQEMIATRNQHMSDLLRLIDLMNRNDERKE